MACTAGDLLLHNYEDSFRTTITMVQFEVHIDTFLAFEKENPPEIHQYR
jgi:hypothetical protein